MDLSALMALFGEGSTGADVSDLTSFKNTVQQNDPWRIAAAPVFGAKFDTSTWSPGETLGVSAGQAFLGGVLNALGQRSEARQLESVASVLPELYSDPMSVGVPEGVDPEAFGQLKLQAIARGSKSQAGQLSKLFEDLWGVGIAGKKAKAEATGKIEGENEAYQTAGGQNPDSPQVKGSDILRKELLGNKEIVEFGDVKHKIQVLRKAMSDPTSVADLDFVYGVAKILDPGSVVRESEGQTIIDSNSIPAATLGYLNKSLSGGTALDRKALYNLAARHYDTRKERVGSILDNYTNLATKRGVDPADILPYEKSSLELSPLMDGAIDRSALEAEAAQLKAQNMSASDIAATLRAKYGSRLPRG